VIIQPSFLRFEKYWLLIILGIAALWRIMILASGTVGFHSDEAVVGLMARHINAGLPIPTFFYGQPYMGSLDPLLTALMFRITGPTVFGLRAVQFLLYLGIVASTMVLTCRLTADRRVAIIAGLLVALPTVSLTLYTSISLGGYGEMLLLGNLLLILGYDLATREDLTERGRWLRWLAMGAVFGLGWWTHNLIIAYAIPVTIVLLLRWRCLRFPMILASAGVAIIFSAPWWIYNLQNNWASINFLLFGFAKVPGNRDVGLNDHLFNYLYLGLPALTGTRFPWTYPFQIPALLVGLLYVAILTASRLAPTGKPQATRFLWIMLISFSLINIGSTFAMDPTSRYLLPLTIPLSILVAIYISALRRRFQWSIIAVPAIIAVNLLVTIAAMRAYPPGITSQWDTATDIVTGYDQQVIDFLHEKKATVGYSTYWAGYRLTFLSEESVILAPELPWRWNLVYVKTEERYPPYVDRVMQVEHPSIVTANLPPLDAVIVERLDRVGITYSRETIGPYTIYYDLSRNVPPVELGLQSMGP
jgi:4-amino-4-deoxy-L-arabinose transferase-like glycosyltransferase